MKVSRKVLGLLLSGLLILVSLIGWWGRGVGLAEDTQVAKESPVADQAPVVTKERSDGDESAGQVVADTISPRIQFRQFVAKQESQKTQVARESLRYDGKSFDEWRTYLTTELKPGLRIEGLKAMGTFGVNGYAEEAASVILEVVKGYDPWSGNVDDGKVTSGANLAIHRIGQAALPSLIRALKGRDGQKARRFAVQILTASSSGGPLWPEMKAVVPALIEAASDDDARLRGRAITALSTIDPDDERVVAALIKATRDKDLFVCDQAIRFLGKVRRHRNRTIPVLIAALKDDRARVRSTAADTLGHIGSGAQNAVPALIEAMKDKDADVRQNAIRALGKITRDPKVLVPPLIEALKSEYQNEYQNTRDSACRLLGKLGEEAKESVPALLAVFWISNPSVRMQICSALGRISTSSAIAIGFLGKVARDQTELPDVQRAAADAMKRILHSKQFKARNEFEGPDHFDDEDQ